MKLIRIFIIILFITSSALAQPYLKNTILVRIKNFTLDNTKLDQILSDENAYIERRILPLKASIRYNTQTLYKASNSPQLEARLKAEEPLLRTYVIGYKGDKDPEKFCHYLSKKYSDIEIAEPYYLQKIQAYTPNDSRVSSQETILKQIRAKEAWEIEKGDSNIVIGISDNAIQQTHPDLKNNIATNVKEKLSGNDDDGNGYIDDYQGYNFDGGTKGEFYWDTFANSTDNHGTFTSGIAGADFDNNLGVAGIGGRSKIFPIRISSKDIGDRYTAYGYESIIYAGVRKFKVLNCSWGLEKRYSAIEQSIIDYAVANDVAIVASAGNLESGQGTMTKFYPAGYKGVLGVGVVTNTDGEASISSLGSHCRIMSPASGNYTTDLDFGQDNPYSFTTLYTSFSAPVVSGAVAIARAKYPKLNAIQAIEFVRQSTDDISDKRFDYKRIVPGRLNMLKMVTTDPMSIPGIVIDDVKFYDNTGAEQNRFFLGDTVFVELNIRNVLGNANGLNFNLSLADPEFKVIDVLDSSRNNISLTTNESMTLGKFEYVIVNQYDGNLTMRLDIKGKDGYKDFLLFDYKNISEIATFENSRIKFSVGDHGTFGFGQGSALGTREGFGFIDKNYGDGLYKSGVFITENDKSTVVSFDFGSKDSKFHSLKPFYKPKNTASIITADPFNDTKAKIDETIELPKYSPWVRIKLDLTDSAALGSQYSIGYDFDWDVGIEFQYSSNNTNFLESARPSNIPTEKFAAIYTGNIFTSQVFGTAMYSDESDAFAQAGGYESGASSFNTEFLINSLRSGKIDITKNDTDIFNIIGMRYNDNFNIYQTKTCYLCVAAAADTSLLSSYLKDCASGTTSVGSKYEESVVYNSADNSFQMNDNEYMQSEIYDLRGAKIFSTDKNRFDLNNLNQGIYLVKIEFKDRFLIKKVSIIR